MLMYLYKQFRKDGDIYLETVKEKYHVPNVGAIYKGTSVMQSLSDFSCSVRHAFVLCPPFYTSQHITSIRYCRGVI